MICRCCEAQTTTLAASLAFFHDRQEDRYEQSDDGNDHQQLNKSEGLTSATHV